MLNRNSVMVLWVWETGELQVMVLQADHQILKMQSGFLLILGITCHWRARLADGKYNNSTIITHHKINTLLFYFDVYKYYQGQQSLYSYEIYVRLLCLLITFSISFTVNKDGSVSTGIILQLQMGSRAARCGQWIILRLFPQIFWMQYETIALLSSSTVNY